VWGRGITVPPLGVNRFPGKAGRRDDPHMVESKWRTTSKSTRRRAGGLDARAAEGMLLPARAGIQDHLGQV
jgi:hypothetical protein